MTSGAGGGASCARAGPKPSSIAAASAIQAKHLRFIFVSPLLSREVAKKGLGATLLRLWQAHGLRLPVLADEQVDLNPFVGALFVHGQAEITESPALHADADDGTVTDFLRHAAGEQREIFGVIGGYEHRFVGGLGSVVVRGAYRLVRGRAGHRRFCDRFRR